MNKGSTIFSHNLDFMPTTISVLNSSKRFMQRIHRPLICVYPYFLWLRSGKPKAPLSCIHYWTIGEIFHRLLSLLMVKYTMLAFFSIYVLVAIIKNG